MSEPDEEDKPTVILDLNALKKQKLKQEEDLASIVTDLEFNIPIETAEPEHEIDFGFGTSDSSAEAAPSFPVILFDYESEFFEKSYKSFPAGYEYKMANTLPELNQYLRSKDFQIVVFNYDANPKVVNQLCAQIKLKFPTSKTLIMAKAISPEKAKIHAASKSGAHGYFQFPLNAEKIKLEFNKIYSKK